MSNSSYKFLFKSIVVGDTGVGKSCLVLQFIEKKIRENHDVTIGVEFGSKIIRNQEENIKLQIWDTAGQENFRSITRSYYRSAAAAVLVYDVTCLQSFNNIENWLNEINENVFNNSNLVLVLVGNKCDINSQRQVSMQQAQKFAEQNHIHFFETSAYTGENVDLVFNTIVDNIHKKIIQGLIDINDETANPGIKQGNIAFFSKLQNLDINQYQKNEIRSSKCC